MKKKLENISGEVPCADCLSGEMVFLKKRSNEHLFFQCNNCKKIDEIAITENDKGEKTLVLMVNEWDEVIKEIRTGLINNLLYSSEKLLKWSDDNKELLTKLQNSIAAWKEFQQLFYSFSGDKKPSLIGIPWQFLIIEADRALFASRSIASIGLYKESYKALRSFFELSLFGLYLNIYQDSDFFNKWFSGKRKTIKITGNDGVIEKLTKNKILSKINNSIEPNWEVRANSQYSNLSKYVHTQGRDSSSLWLWQHAHQNFNIESWEKWILTTINTIETVIIAIISIHPRSLIPIDYFMKFGFNYPAGLFFDEQEVQIIKSSFLDKRCLEVIQSIVERDKETINLINDTKKIKDLKPEEIEETKNNFIDSVKKPEYKEEINEINKILENKLFANNKTVQWSILLSIQKRIMRNLSLGQIGMILNLIKNED